MSEVINGEINKYWSLLNYEQRESILGMIKSFLPSTQEGEYSNEFKEDLDNRYNDIASGKATIVSAKESKERINNILRGIKNE